MRLIRLALISTIVWAGLGTSPASAQFMRSGFNFGNPQMFNPQVGFATNGFRYGYSASYGLTVTSNGVRVSVGYSGAAAMGYTSAYPIYPYYGLNPYGYSGYSSAYNPFGSYIQGGVGGYAPPTTTLNQGDSGANARPGVFNEWKDRDRGPRAEERRQQVAQDQLERMLNQPTENDILSGAALNAILNALESGQARLKDVPPVVIGDDTLANINFSKGVSSASPALLADAGQLAWPRPLQGLGAADGVRKQITDRFAEAYQQAAAGKKVEPGVLKDLDSLSRQLETVIGENVSKLGFQEHRDAKRFLKLLDDAISFLKLPDAGQWLPGKTAIGAKSIQELVKTMQNKGAKFAPASPGGERAYYAVHRGLADYYHQAMPAQVAAAPK